MKALQKIFGDPNKKTLKKLQPIVQQINAKEESVKQLADSDFPKETQKLKDRLAAGETLDDILIDAFALVREAAWRTLQMRHYDVQLMGGIIIHQGKIAEMRTGEGKTLVATLPVYLNALAGEGVHMITVNDYLARRDAQWMGQVYAFLGLSIGVINDQNQAYLYDANHEEVDEERDTEGGYKVFYEFLKPTSKMSAYEADITYGTNNQFGFDYLRDNLARRPEALVQKNHAFCIIDEIDSVLIDEARVPLIISTTAAQPAKLYQSFAQVAKQMKRDEDFEVDEKLRAIEMTDDGIAKAEKLLKVDNLFTNESIMLVHHLETAIRANALYEKDKDYVIKDGKVIIVDPFTGRMQDGRRWSDGLHQAVEAKESVAIQAESQTVASITYQNYFRMYKKLSGMTGTAATSSEEFNKVYNLEVVVVPTNKPIARIDNVDFIYQNERAKFKAVAKKAKELQQKGQPVLIGTVSVEKNEQLSEFLTKEGVKHQALNAKNHEKEGEIIAAAGAKGAVTIATNMAGRGVDIKLGGIPFDKTKEQEIKDLGGLYVIGTERHEAARIDNQLRGRSGRQGDPGETQFFVALTDELMVKTGSARVQGVLSALNLPEDEPIQHKFISKQMSAAQTKMEGHHFDGRKYILSFDDVITKHRESVYARRKRVLLSEEEEIKKIYNSVLDISETPEMIKDKKEKLGDKVFYQVVQQTSLSIIDRLWMRHLEVMDHARRAANLRAHGQHDPLVEYKKESVRLFRDLESDLYYDLSKLLERLDVEAIQTQMANAKKVAENPNTKIPGYNAPKKGWVRITKKGQVKEVKEKKLQQWLDAGWKIVE